MSVQEGYRGDAHCSIFLLTPPIPFCKVCRLDWNKLLPPECVPSDASSQSQSQSQGDLATSKHSELTDPDIYGTENQGTGVDVDECNPVYETFDVIIASDIVCCDSDAVGVAHTLLHFLKREGVGGLSTNPCPVAIFVVPSEFHRLLMYILYLYFRHHVCITAGTG